MGVKKESKYFTDVALFHALNTSWQGDAKGKCSLWTYRIDNGRSYVRFKR
jgi:hypothetical protein